jgi:hypothetical protein
MLPALPSGLGPEGGALDLSADDGNSLGDSLGSGESFRDGDWCGAWDCSVRTGALGPASVSFRVEATTTAATTPTTTTAAAMATTNPVRPRFAGFPAVASADAVGTAWARAPAP